MIHTSKFLLGYYKNYFDDTLPVPEAWETEFGGRTNRPICDEARELGSLDMNHGSSRGPDRLVDCPNCIKIMKGLGI